MAYANIDNIKILYKLYNKILNYQHKYCIYKQFHN